MNSLQTEIAALYCVYHDDIWLPYSYASIYSAVDAIYFFVSDRPWNGPKTDNANTLSCIEALEDPQKKKRIISGSWDNQVDQRNFSVAQTVLDGFQYGFVVDADEIYETAELKNMFAYAVSKPEVEVWHCKMLTYWDSPDYRIDPPEPHDPPILIKLGSCGFVETRNPVSNSHELIPAKYGVCHHLSYARPDDLIYRKIHAISAAPDIRKDWYENVWLEWKKNPDLTNLHPVHPPHYQRAVRQPRECLPSVLRDNPWPEGFIIRDEAND